MALREYDDGTNVLVRFHECDDRSRKGIHLLLSPDDRDGVWLPKSKVAYIDHDAGEVWIPEWLAKKKGLDYE